MERSDGALEKLHQDRRRLEGRLRDVREAIDREVGWAPRGRRWVLPLLGFAAGIALALAVRSRRRDREE